MHGIFEKKHHATNFEPELNGNGAVLLVMEKLSLQAIPQVKISEQSLKHHQSRIGSHARGGWIFKSNFRNLPKRDNNISFGQLHWW